MHLKYREPVGVVALVDSGQQLVDEHAVLLPLEDVDPVRLGPLIRISGGTGLAAPADPRPGVIWKSRTSPGGLETVNESIVAAAGLAGFIARKRRLSPAENSPALKVIEIMFGDFNRRGLFLVNGERSVIWWWHPPGAESSGEPSAEEKWAMVERLATNDDRTIIAGSRLLGLFGKGCCVFLYTRR